MGGKCATLVDGTQPLLKETTQAALFEAGPTLLPRAWCCTDLNKDPDAKSFMLAPVIGYATVASVEDVTPAFSAEHRQGSTNSLWSQSSGDIAPHEALQDEPQAAPCSRDLKRQGWNQSLSESDIEGMSEAEKHREAKRIIKDFVTEMVRGKEMVVVAPSGALVDCIFGLTRALDALKIRPRSPKGAPIRRILLSSVDEIMVGTDTGYSQMETPLDELCVSLVLRSDDCVTFRMSDVESRDTLVACLTMFGNEAKAGTQSSLL